ncbi:hypothetical protein [Saccharothrix variisporea]|uniref:Uncharacterized protein n=1 Tax=Saccharothrix variisporea TaxID=543527 RepID=A0A495X4A4_9PSEU|nr:hypothetical protein [Saccharothrix variisporea]RKT68349.1 hypothetical protein DFJ66_1532 [Saccharothrix variisporea]
MTPDEAVALLTDPESPAEDRYQAHADLTAAAASGDREAEAALHYLRWNRSGRTACDAD